MAEASDDDFEVPITPANRSKRRSVSHKRAKLSVNDTMNLSPTQDMTGSSSRKRKRPAKKSESDSSMNTIPKSPREKLVTHSVSPGGKGIDDAASEGVAEPWEHTAWANHVDSSPPAERRIPERGVIKEFQRPYGSIPLPSHGFFETRSVYSTTFSPMARTTSLGIRPFLPSYNADPPANDQESLQQPLVDDDSSPPLIEPWVNFSPAPSAKKKGKQRASKKK